MRSSAWRDAALVAVLVSAGSGCGRSAAPAPDTTTATVPTDPVPSVLPDTAGFDTARVRIARSANAVSVLDAVTIDGGRRTVAFTFRDSMAPGIDVGYAAGPVMQCGSGEPVSVDGTEALVIRFSLADAHVFEGEDVVVTVAERNRRLDGPLFAQAIQICDFEAQLEWVLGLRSRPAFRVLDSAQVGRYVIEFAPGRQ